ncbi:hypothetical protein [Treponema sp.]|uniref:hypothetical protein n=1 Tax=Treponema sp. TaxID=166 RepID=UPI00388E60E1
MKKFKLICSAIAAFTLLALAGCDLEIPEKSKVYYGKSVSVMSGTASGDFSDSMTGYGCAMIGTWNISSYVDDVQKESDALRTGTTWWSASWTDGKNTEQSISDGQTLKIVASAQDDGAQIFFEVYGNGCYVSLNPSDGNTWGTGTTYSNKNYSACTFYVGTVVTFTATKSGNAITYEIIADNSDVEEDD